MIGVEVDYDFGKADRPGYGELPDMYRDPAYASSIEAETIYNCRRWVGKLKTLRPEGLLQIEKR